MYYEDFFAVKKYNTAPPKITNTQGKAFFAFAAAAGDELPPPPPSPIAGKPADAPGMPEVVVINGGLLFTVTFIILLFKTKIMRNLPINYLNNYSKNIQ